MMAAIDYYGRGRWEARPQKAYQREKIALQLLLSLVDEDTSLLDAGCGDGWMLREISEKRPRSGLFGIDSSPFQLATSSAGAFASVRANLESGIPFASGSFDLVYAAEIVEHLYNPDSFLFETHRVLRNGGHLLLSTPNLCAWFNRILFLFGIQPLFMETSTRSKLSGSGFSKRFKKGETPVGHVRIFNKDAITDLLSDNGFDILAVRGAVFDAGFPPWLVRIDNLFRHAPSLSSDLVILARKKSTV